MATMSKYLSPQNTLCHSHNGDYVSRLSHHVLGTQRSTTTMAAVRGKAVFTGLVARTERSAQRQCLYSEVAYTPQIRSLPTPPIVDIVSQDNNNLVTTQYFKRLYDTINTIEEFNVDSKAACDPLNLAHETKTKNASAHLVQYRFKIREASPEGIRRLWWKGFVKEMSFKSGVKGRGSDR